MIFVSFILLVILLMISSQFKFSSEGSAQLTDCLSLPWGQSLGSAGQRLRGRPHICCLFPSKCTAETPGWEGVKGAKVTGSVAGSRSCPLLQKVFFFLCTSWSSFCIKVHLVTEHLNLWSLIKNKGLITPSTITITVVHNYSCGADSTIHWR